MKKVWKQLRFSVASVLMMALLLTMTVFAEGSGDNSLASLGVENGTVTPDFEYSIWEYDVTVAPGTTELSLNPVPSDPNAQILSIDGATIGEDGTATVIITVQAENGTTFPYTLHVTTDQSAAPADTGTEAPPQTEAPQTEAPQTENQEIKELQATNTLLRSQANEYKETSEMQMKIIYGLIALAVILIFIIVNQLLRNRDLKEDLKEIENHIDSHSKEKGGSSDTYYTPQQGRGVPKYVPPVNTGNYQEETFRQVEKNPQQEVDKAAAKKAARAEKRAARAEVKAAKKASKYEQQNEQPINQAPPVRQPMRQPQNSMNVPPVNNQMGSGMNGSMMRQPQSGMNGPMTRQPQGGVNTANPSMNNPAGNAMGGYTARQPQVGAQAAGNRQPQNDVPIPKEPENSNVEVDMIDL